MRSLGLVFRSATGVACIVASAGCSGAGGGAEVQQSPPPFGSGSRGGSAVAPGAAVAPPPLATSGGPAESQLFLQPGQESSGRAATGCGPNLTGVLRDFLDSHPDFGDAVADDRGLVQERLGADRKPVYAPTSDTVTTSGAANFNQWYRDTPGVNQSTPFTLPFQEREAGVWTYDNQQFFPLDGQLLGNEFQDHNYLFTFELHTEFAYRGGEVFTFAGDDDLWIFINGQLAIDLGGVHGTQTDQIDLDDEAAELGLVPGSSYALDLFQAERHPTGSTFRVDTSLRFTSCGTVLR
jgi:fibro-slime domain-containing protein